MLRRLILGLAAASALSAAVLPEAIGPQTRRTKLDPLALTDRPVWEEYGVTESETGRYEGSGRALSISAWRLKDPTGAQAAFRWLKPANATAGNADQLTYSPFAASTPDGGLMTFHSYVLRFEGRNPTLDELKLLLFQLPKVDQSSLPPLLNYVPKADMVQGSDRYVIGPASLEKFFPKVGPAAVGFHFGAEALVARYKGRNGETEMALFYYPTNPMAKDREPEFSKIPGAVVKRSGPLLAVALSPQNADDAQRLLALVDYKVTITFDEPQPGTQARKAGNIFVTAFVMAALLVGIGVLGGAMMYGMRYLRRRRTGLDDDSVTVLHLGDHHPPAQ